LIPAVPAFRQCHAAPAVDPESLRYRRVILRGTYDAPRQVLIDNRLHQERAGYHVITPLRLEGSSMHVLVNRGWLPAAADHRIQPLADRAAGN
jgi:surfeit locus 1 family protein